MQKWGFLVTNMSWCQTFNFQIVFGYLTQVLVFLCYDGDFSLLFILKLFFDLSLAEKKKKLLLNVVNSIANSVSQAFMYRWIV